MIPLKSDGLYMNFSKLFFTARKVKKIQEKYIIINSIINDKSLMKSSVILNDKILIINEIIIKNLHNDINPSGIIPSILPLDLTTIMNPGNSEDIFLNSTFLHLEIASEAEKQLEHTKWAPPIEKCKKY